MSKEASRAPEDTYLPTYLCDLCVCHFAICVSFVCLPFAIFVSFVCYVMCFVFAPLKAEMVFFRNKRLLVNVHERKQ